MTLPATAVENSKNSKVGLASATYASQSSCPTSCPFLNKGCYAETGHCGITTSRLNKSNETNQNKIAQLEASLIDTLSGKFPLRVHVVGDCSTNTAAKTVSAAMERYTERSGMPAWSYTHAWREVSPKSWGSANVLASCESIKDIKKAIKRGWKACSIVVEKFKSTRTYEEDGIKLIPCPAQTKGKDSQGNYRVTCVDCKLCFDTSRLKKANVHIAFEPDHNTSKKIVPSLS